MKMSDIKSWKEFQFLVSLFNIKGKHTFAQILKQSQIYAEPWNTAYKMKRELIELDILKKCGATEMNGRLFHLFKINHRNLMWFFREDVIETKILQRAFDSVELQRFGRPKRKIQRLCGQ